MSSVSCSQQDVSEGRFYLLIPPYVLSEHARHNSRTGGLSQRTLAWSNEITKFINIFTEMALYRAKDAWWDEKTTCIMTQADEEMMNILTQDKDLIFTETKVQIDLSGKQKEGKQTSSSQTQFNINRINLYFPYDSNTEHQSNT